MDILLTAGLPWPTILYTILIDEIMIITGLVGALVASSYKVRCFAQLHTEMLLMTTIVGILHLRLPCPLLDRMDPHLDWPQVRSFHWLRCLKNLHYRWYLDHLPLVPLPDCMGTFRGW